jgi:osmotically-inducible protein OsmY
LISPLDRYSTSDVTKAAEASLQANSLVLKGAIRVSVDDGWLTMAGNVERHFQRRATEHTVRHLAAGEV